MHFRLLRVLRRYLKVDKVVPTFAPIKGATLKHKMMFPYRTVAYLSRPLSSCWVHLSEVKGKLFSSIRYSGVLLTLIVCGIMQAQSSRTTVEGRVYTADGVPAIGSLTVSWPAFTTADEGDVEAGSATASIGRLGDVSIKVPPNAGAIPTPIFAKAVYHFSDGTESTELWSIPAVKNVSVADVRKVSEVAGVTDLENSIQAHRTLSSTDSFLPLYGGTLTGPLLLAGDPVSSLQASSKHYVDQAVATAIPLSGGVVTGTLAIANQVAKLPRVDMRSVDFAGGTDPTGGRDSLAAIQAAIAFAMANVASTGEATYPTLYLAPGHYKVNGTIRIPNSLHMVGDSKANTILQETGASASLVTVYGATTCSVYNCFGGLENITLEGTGKATTGSLLEMNVGAFILRDMHFFNSAGRGLQMNGPSERVVSYDSSFNDIRWPLVMAGDTNEDYFYNTQIIEAGQTKDNSGSPTWNSNWCYSVNCTNGVFNGPGTSANPTILYPDPHGSIHIDKAVNVSFIGGSIKSTDVLSGVRVWNGDIIKFENLYHEDVYGGSIPRTNRAYIIAGAGEQTYLTGTLAGNGLVVAVHDPSWMPQYFSNPSDVLPIASRDYYGYVLMPQDYNRASTASSAYVPGLQQNQYEIVSIGGFASDGNLYIQANGRNQVGSTAPAGTQWPAGTVIEQYGNGGTGTIEFNNIHLNQIQGPTAVGGYQVGCDQTNTNACGEMVAGYAPDIQKSTSNPATNRVGFYAPLGDPNDPVPGAAVSLSLRSMDMGNNAANPYVGQIATHHRVFMQIYGSVNTEGVESIQVVNGNGSGKQLNIGSSTGGSYVTAPVYPSTGQPAAVQVSLPNAGTLWDSSRNVFTKQTSLFGQFQQFGAYMNGLQFANQYCLFDLPSVDGGHAQNRFCVNGGPSNNASNTMGHGGGIEYDSWDGTHWINLFKIFGQNGAGIASGGAVPNINNPPIMVWSPFGVCNTQLQGCQEGGSPLNLVNPITIRQWTAYAPSIPAGCSVLPVLSLMNGPTVLGTISMSNGVNSYTGILMNPAVPANSSLQIVVSTAGVGCTSYSSQLSSNVTYSMQ